MDIKNMHEIIELLVCCTKAEFDKKGIERINVKEMKEVTDMINDLAEAQYYRTLVEAMNKSRYGEDYDKDGPMDGHIRGYKGNNIIPGEGNYMRRGYDEMLPIDYHEIGRMRDMDMEMNRMYYSGGGSMNGMTHGGRDYREGRSGNSRRGYMEAKDMHKDETPEAKQKKMKELENYMKDLSMDVTEMISSSSAEEKNMLKTKMQELITKIN